MANKRITISANILNEFAQEEQIDDISLKFNLSDQYKSEEIDLSSLSNETLQRRKDLKKFKDFLLNTPRSLNTKLGLYNSFKKLISDIGDEFDSTNNLTKLIKKYALFLAEKVNRKEMSVVGYSSYKTRYKTIFTECYGLNHKEFLDLFPEYSKRTGRINNATILDRKGREKAFSKEQFKEITKIALNLSYFFENALLERIEYKNEPVQRHLESRFKYRDVFDLGMFLNRMSNPSLKNKKTLCLMVVLICLTGLNLSPVIRMKRSDISIDKERSMISFSVICNRKGKEQLHNYPMRNNQLNFFEKILENSKSVAPNDDILFPCLSNEEIASYFSDNINTFYDFFNTGFSGSYKGLILNATKLRHSFGSQFDDIDVRAVALFNSTKTAAKHYSTGNADENNQLLQNAMNIYTIALSANEDIEFVKSNIEKINVINITDIQTLKQENSQITSNGVFCIDSKTGHEPEKFARRIEKLGLNNIESIHCANILACFSCKNSIIVNDFENVYLLKSFYNYLNSIIYESNTSSLFSDENAVKKALLSIQIILETKIDKKIIQKVDKHISKHGKHPLWDIDGEFV